MSEITAAKRWSVTAPMYGVGVVLVASGVFHVVIAILDGGSWSGDISWRKPILFGFSAGATMISLGWVAGKVRPRRGDSFRPGLVDA